MINFTDIIKNSFLEEFSSITIGSLLTALLLSCVLSLFIVLVYRLTYGGVLFNGRFALSLVLLSMITSVVIITVSSSVVLSLGMVGALSIVRFRTAVKDPMDTIFMFWAIVTGITTGAGLVSISVIACLAIGLIFLLVNLLSGKMNRVAYMVILRFDSSAVGEVERTLKSILPYTRIKSRSANALGEEIVLEARVNENVKKAFYSLKRIEGVKEVNMVSYGGNTLL